MIRLYLKAYNAQELTDLYNVMSFARAAIPEASTRLKRDIDEALLYITGYADALHERGERK